MSTDIPRSEVGEPPWEIATLFPNQGQWSDNEYLRLETNKLVELNDGKLEVLSMPTELHQLIMLFLRDCLRDWAKPRSAGLALVAPLRVRLWEGKFREPDVVFMMSEHQDRRSNQFWDCADLVMEIVSDDDPHRDLVDKRSEYARAGIPEYWIIDPRDRSIIVLTLPSNESQYQESGRYVNEQFAASVLLPDFLVSVTQAFDQDQ
jgi:Uma2 family endonuclease